MKFFLAASLLSLPSLALAQDAATLPPKSVELLKQYDEYEAGKVKALNEDLLRVKKGVVTQLKKHLQDATKNSKLDQSQSLIAKIKELEINIKELEVSNRNFSTKTYTFKLAGNGDRWTNTKIRVTKGQTVTVKVTGEVGLNRLNNKYVSNGDGMNIKKYGVDSSLNLGLLIGRMSTDDKKIYPLGKSASFKAEKSGSLEMTVNDHDLSNNTGHWDIEIEVK